MKQAVTLVHGLPPPGPMFPIAEQQIAFIKRLEAITYEARLKRFRRSHIDRILNRRYN